MPVHSVTASLEYLKKRKQKKEQFVQTLLDIEKRKNSHSILTQEKYNILLQEVVEAKAAERKTPLHSRRLKRFDIFEIGGIQKLISIHVSDEFQYYLPVEEIFDAIEAAHLAINHCGRDRLKVETAKLYANITIDMVNIYLSMCEECEMKKGKKKKGLILQAKLNSLCQLDIIDMDSQADGKYKYIMLYQDQLTKYIILRALETKNVTEVSSHLKYIFLTFGAPCVLRCENWKELNLILNKLWPDMVVMDGKAQPSQRQRLVENPRQDIEQMLAAWMRDNNTTEWSQGLPFTQFRKNQSWHAGLNKSPYKAMFGVEPKVYLASSSYSKAISFLKGEMDMDKVVGNMKTGNQTEKLCDNIDVAENQTVVSPTNISCGMKDMNDKNDFFTNAVCINYNNGLQLKSVREAESRSSEHQAKRIKLISD